MNRADDITTCGGCAYSELVLGIGEILDGALTVLDLIRECEADKSECFAKLGYKDSRTRVDSWKVTL